MGDCGSKIKNLPREAEEGAALWGDALYKIYRRNINIAAGSLLLWLYQRPLSWASLFILFLGRCFVPLQFKICSAR
ncbi:UNVERIFIED_CONTAM: hypothetical protein FKN15_003278 [Acipenser sinensis]